MEQYSIRSIHPNDRFAMAEVDQLLLQQGIRRDANLEYTVGLYDGDGKLAGTGSCFGNTLRCLAVSSLHRGEGLMNSIVTALMEYELENGIQHIFIYTKPESVRFFTGLGFYEIVRTDSVVLLENKPHGFSSYLSSLERPVGRNIAAVVLNANPFSLGHQYLCETAAAQSDILHIFTVSEDRSLIPFAVRERLVRGGTAHLKNAVYHSTGSYMISAATFPSYFLRDTDLAIAAQAELDGALFAKIAVQLGINIRYLGKESPGTVTAAYNACLATLLPKTGIACRIIPRKETACEPISASIIREKIKSGDISAIRSLVPQTTFEYFASEEALPVISRIQLADDVKHY